MFPVREYRGQNEIEKEFIKDFNTITRRHNRREVWDDAMLMMAIEMCNALSPHHETWQKRNDTYAKVISKYNEEEQTLFAHLLAYITMALEENPDQDFLGKLYMMLDFGGNRGQFFTPYEISRLMSEITFDVDDTVSCIKDHGQMSVNDPCCGAGGMLIAFANVCREHRINYQNYVIFVAQDIDQTAAYMCYIQLSLLGCIGYVVIGNSLTNPITGSILFPRETENLSILYTPMYYMKLWRLYRRCHTKKNNNTNNLLATVKLTDVECYCDIYTLFVHIAEHVGVIVPTGSIFNAKKIYVSEHVHSKVCAYYELEEQKSPKEINELWSKYGPTIGIESNTYAASVDDEFIYEMRIG